MSETRLERGAVGCLGSSREVRKVPSVARESTLHCKLNSQLPGAAMRSILSAGPEIDNGNPGVYDGRRHVARDASHACRRPGTQRRIRKA